MTTSRPRLLIVAGVILACAVFTRDALGYIDPGTGSYVLQIAIAFLVGIAFSVKVFWKKIISFLRKAFARNRGAGPDAA